MTHHEIAASVPTWKFTGTADTLLSTDGTTTSWTKINGAKLDSTGFSSGQAYVWNGTAFVATTVLSSLSGAVTNVTAGAGLTGGGSGSVNLDVSVDTTSIVIASDTLSVGVVNDTQHGSRSGGALHAAVTNAAAGFAPAISAANRVLLSTSGTAAVWAQVADAQISGVDWSKVAGRPTTLAGYGITDAAATSTTFTAGAGMTGGGTLAAPRTFDVVAADGTIVVNADSIQVGSIGNANISAVAWSKVTGAPTTLTGYGITDAVASSRSLTGSGAITVDGNNAAHDLTANRTIAVASATTGAVGVVQLASDLGGTATAPHVVGLAGASSIVAVHAQAITWDAAIFSAFLNLANDTRPSDAGANLTIAGQNNLGSLGTGGSVFVTVGTGHAACGQLQFTADDSLAGNGVAGISLNPLGVIDIQTRQITFDDNLGRNVAVLGLVYNGQTELTFAQTLSRFDLDFEDVNINDGAAASIHITAQNNGGTGSAVGGSLFFTSGTGTSKPGSIVLALGTTKIIELDGGKIGFFNGTPVGKPSAYTVAHHTDVRFLDEVSPDLSILTHIVGTLLKDLGGGGGGGYNLLQ